MTFRPRITVLFLAVAASLLVSTGPAAALYKQGSAWPNGEVPVCWMSTFTTHPQFATFNRWAQEAANGGWARVASLRFTGWGNCPADTRGKLALTWDNNASDYASHVGYVATATSLVSINYPEQGPDLFKWTILHEFGHVLGFGHEMDRPENPERYPNGCWGTDQPGDPLGTLFDNRSVMHYCSGSPTTLSGWDIVGVQKLYGRKPSGSLVGLENRAVAPAFGSTSPGVTLQLATSRPTPLQEWTLSTLLGTLSTFYNAGALGTYTYCMEPAGSLSPTSGTLLRTALCTVAPGQRFAFENVELRGIGEKCVEHDGTTPASGALVQIRTCSGTTNQRWTLTGSNQLKAGTSGFCLQAVNAVSNELLRLAPCSAVPAQTFTLNAGGRITSRGLCLNSQWGDPTDGRLVQLYPCTAGSPNELWHFTGPVKHDTRSHCLDIRGGVPFDGAGVQLYPCHSGANQIWDYHFR